jgi:hypothetical protein
MLSVNNHLGDIVTGLRAPEFFRATQFIRDGIVDIV